MAMEVHPNWNTLVEWLASHGMNTSPEELPVQARSSPGQLSHSRPWGINLKGYNRRWLWAICHPANRCINPIIHYTSKGTAKLPYPFSALPS